MAHDSFAAVGTRAPDFRAPSSHGQTLDRDAFVGKVPVVLLFPPPDADRAGPLLREFDRRLVEFGHRRVQVLAVLPQTQHEVRATAEAIPLTVLPLLADPDHSITEAYGAATDEGFVIDVTGVVRAVVPLDVDTVEHVLATATLPTAGSDDDPGGASATAEGRRA